MNNVRTGYKNEKWFRVTTGVKQGSVLSPLLFIAYMDTVIKDFKDRINISEDIMIFADDIAFWTYDHEELERALICLNDCLTEAGLKMNIEKTEILTIDKQPQAATNITIRDTVIKDTDTFKYLECIFTDEGQKNKEEITERIKDPVLVFRMLSTGIDFKALLTSSVAWVSLAESVLPPDFGFTMRTCLRMLNEPCWISFFHFLKRIR